MSQSDPSAHSPAPRQHDMKREKLLKGREDLLAIVSAQLLLRAERDDLETRKRRIWVDVGGGTGYNIEAMSKFLDVPKFFDAVYMVELVPSLCEIARERFCELGWTNVHVICQDARAFRLEDYELPDSGYASSPVNSGQAQRGHEEGGADLITLSYSLSMIPDFHAVIDRFSNLLSPHGIIGVIDFYVQSEADASDRTYTGGLFGRHVNYLSRTLWRAWFELDWVGLEPARRDYLEYRLGTILTLNLRNKSLGSIPYYIWIGCRKDPTVAWFHHGAAAAQSPLWIRKGKQNDSNKLNLEGRRGQPDIPPKVLELALHNLSANLPLPAAFYQNQPWRVYYDDRLERYTQFSDEYIYSFTWEDSEVDQALLNIGPDDTVLAITSAGDNVLSYALHSPAKIHAVDLNPAQNHLLELKLAGYMALPYSDFWQLFGEGKHPDFRSLLTSRLSAHLSSRAFQYWLHHANVFNPAAGRGLYDTGGSRHALPAIRWASRLVGRRKAVKQLLEAPTLEKQRSIWIFKMRPALSSTLISHMLVQSEGFLWKALGVPKTQLAMIEEDYASSFEEPMFSSKRQRGNALYQYMMDTLEPVFTHCHVASENPYYFISLAGTYTPQCHPEYLAPQAHEKLSQRGALDKIRIHTDSLVDVLEESLSPGSLTVAVIMDSMDWFAPGDETAVKQVEALNRALAMNGRVLFRSAARVPWYVRLFEERGFVCEKRGDRQPGKWIDRVNMYASCWVGRKVADLEGGRAGG